MMSEALTEQQRVASVVTMLLELKLDSRTVYLHSGDGDLTWNSQTWKGVGANGSISSIADDTGMSDGRIQATLSHVPVSSFPDFLTELSENDPVGRAFTVYAAFLPENGGDPAPGDVVLLTNGFIDAVEMTDGGGTRDSLDGVITLTLASETALARPTDDSRPIADNSFEGGQHDT